MRSFVRLGLLCLALVPSLALAAGPTKADLAAARAMPAGASVTISPGHVTTQHPTRTINGTVITGSRNHAIDAAGRFTHGSTQTFRGVRSGVTTTLTRAHDGTRSFHILAPVPVEGAVLGRPPVTTSGAYTPAALATARKAVVAEAARRSAAASNR